MLTPRPIETDIPMEDVSTETLVYTEDELLDGQVETQPKWHYSEVVEVGSDISDTLTDGQLSELAAQAILEYEIDETSRAPAIRAYDAAMKAARAERVAKTFPFTNAANVRYPLINTATFQFAARAYPAIIRGSDIVKVKVVGEDPDGQKAARATRIASHMSYQLIDEMPEWEKQIDELLHHLPLAGTAFRCIYYDEELGRNTSELVSMKEFVINNDAKSLPDCPRYTRIRQYYPDEISSKMRSGFYRNVEVDLNGDQDSLKQQIVLEQHRKHDLDGDGIAEPYVVTIHKDTQQVLRVVPSADLDTYVRDIDRDGEIYTKHAQHEPMYVRYIFLPDPEGKIHGIGFGMLLESISESINTTLNQMLDAGTLQNAGGGFIGGGVDFGKRREIRTRPGEWLKVKSSGLDISQALVPHKHAGPSAVLFNLLGLLVDMGKEVANVKDVLSGESSGANMPVGTVHALVEQGLQQFTAIYKRVYRSLTEEFRLCYRLNSQYLSDEQYANYHDGKEPVSREDYADDMNVLPVSDPTSVTSMQRVAKIGMLQQMVSDPVLGPTLDPQVITRKTLEAMSFDDIDEVMAKPDPEGMKLSAAAQELDIEQRYAEIDKIESETEKNLAQAEQAERKAEIDEARLVVDSLKAGAEKAA